MKNLVYILFLIFNLSSTLFYAQNYVSVLNHSGIDLYDDPELEIAAAELSARIEVESNEKSFQVYGFDYYPILGYVEPNQGFEHSRAFTDEYLAGKSYYLSIAREHHSLDEAFNLSGNIKVLYDIRIKLPQSAQFADVPLLKIQAIEKELEEWMNIEASNFGETLAKETDMIKELVAKINASSLSELSQEDLVNAGYVKLNKDVGMTITSEVNEEFNTEARSDEYIISKITLTQDDVSNLIEEFIDAEYNFFLTQFDLKLYTTSTDVSVENNNWMANQLYSFDGEDQINLAFYHYKNTTTEGLEEDEMYMLLNVNISEALAEVITEITLYEEFQNQEISIGEVKGDGNESPETRNSEWKYAHQFMMSDLFANTFNEGACGEDGCSPTAYGAAVGCGIVDGLIGSVKTLYDMSKGAAKVGGGVIKKTFSYFASVIKYGIQEKSIFAMHKKVVVDGFNTFKNFAAKVKEIYEIVLKIGDLTYEQIKGFVGKVWDGIYGYFQTIASYTLEGGYEVGKIAFEIIFTVLTAGAGSAVVGSKYVVQFISYLKKMNLNKIADFITDMFKKAPKNNKKFLTCGIGIKGCFVRNTPVLLSSKSLAVAAALPIVAVPIQDVQLFDYALAHKTVNSSYGLIASADEDDTYLGLNDKDPYTSDQQRERDEYEINDRDWNEVVFEEVNGSSIAKLALHSDWINDKGYQVDIVVNMDLPEQGISGPFRITSIKHIKPQKKPVDDDESDDYGYRLVTGLFTHVSDQVYNIDFVVDYDEGGNNGEELGVTYQHPIYSVTAGDWRLAGELEVGEEVLIKSGEAVVKKSERKEGSETVYNLEIKDWHNFLVGEIGIVVHNAYKKSEVLKYLDNSDDFADLADDFPAKKALQKLKEMKDSGDPNFQKYMDDFDLVPLELGEGGVKAWKVLLEHKSLRTNVGELEIVSKYLSDNPNVSLDFLISEIPSSLSLAKVWVKRLDGKRIKVLPTSISQLGQSGGAVLIDLQDELGNSIGKLKRITESGGNKFSYYYTDYVGGNGLIKNHQYKLNPDNVSNFELSPAGIINPNNDNILYGDLLPPLSVNDNVSGLGKTMFDDAFIYFDNQVELDGVYGYWKVDADYYADYGGESINLTKFKEALSQGMSYEEAAFQTITGPWTAEKGFNSVEILDILPPNANATNITDIHLTFKP